MHARLHRPARIGAACLLLASLAASAGCDALAQLLNANYADTGVAIDEPAPPPPISGGTLLVTDDGALAVAADPDGDRVFIVDLQSLSIRHEIALDPGDEPGRVVAGPEGTAYVALRSGGALAAVDLESGALTRRPACPAPRGVAYDAARDEVHVACAGGELITFPAADTTAAPTRSLRLDRDLRDVVVQGDRLLVSRFRSAEVLSIDEGGAVASRIDPAPYQSANNRYFEPAVAWRMLAVPGGVAMVHQRAFADSIPTGPSSVGGTYYGGACDQAVVHAAVTVFGGDAAVRLTASNMGGVGNLTLPVDIAVSADGRVAVVGAGADVVFETSLGAVKTSDALEGCTPSTVARTFGVSSPIAAAYAADGRLVVQGRSTLLHLVEPDGYVLHQVPFPTTPQLHSGHTRFHAAAAGITSPIACASCHPEGRDDGRVWHFEGIGPRRTQAMVGGVLDTAPLHWDGDMDSLDKLMGEVFVNRMGGALPDAHGIEALAEWMQSLPALPPSAAADEALAARGEELFNDPTVGCASCHSGAALTNDQTVDVGTGKAFQVPSLVGVADRAPFMHDGCAETLRVRFDPACGGGDAHGKTSQLAPEDIDALVAYLETL